MQVLEAQSVASLHESPLQFYPVTPVVQPMHVPLIHVAEAQLAS